MPSICNMENVSPGRLISNMQMVKPLGLSYANILAPHNYTSLPLVETRFKEKESASVVSSCSSVEYVEIYIYAYNALPLISGFARRHSVPHQFCF